MEELNRKVTVGIEKFINLLAIYLLKTILFPLAFFYLTVYVIRKLWSVELNPQA
jgi:hypothetical protein